MNDPTPADLSDVEIAELERLYEAAVKNIGRVDFGTMPGSKTEWSFFIIDNVPYTFPGALGKFYSSIHDRMPALLRRIRSADDRTEEAEAERDETRKQLPKTMEHCTIVYKSCPKGHGWLTATNWVQHGCPTCERDSLRAEVERLQSERKAFVEWAEQMVKATDFPASPKLAKAIAEVAGLHGQT